MGIHSLKLALFRGKLMLVSVILPVKDEPYAKQLQHDIHKVLGGNCEVLFQHEEGIANAVWHGINRAKGELVAVMDGDGSHSPLDLAVMVKSLEESPNIDVIVGNRIINYYPFSRKILSLFCAWLTRNFLSLHLQDPLSALIVGKREAMQFNNFNGCKFLLDIVAKKPRNKVATYPVIHKPRRNHKSKLKPIEGVYLLKQLLRLKRESHQ